MDAIKAHHHFCNRYLREPVIVVPPGWYYSYEAVISLSVNIDPESWHLQGGEGGGWVLSHIITGSVGLVSDHLQEVRLHHFQITQQPFGKTACLAEWLKKKSSEMFGLTTLILAQGNLEKKVDSFLLLLCSKQLGRQETRCKFIMQPAAA